jgi:hypothetical protein
VVVPENAPNRPVATAPGCEHNRGFNIFCEAQSRVLLVFPLNAAGSDEAIEQYP